MKKLMKLLPISLIALTLFYACSEGDNTIDTVLDDFETGAILRTLSVNNNILNASQPDSEFSVTVEEQDEQDGALLESVDIYVSIRDLTSDNGITVAADKFVKTVPSSSFTVGPLGLPRATISTTFGETSSAMGLGPDDYTPGDLFVIELRVNLTDGRTYGAASAGGIITGGYFSSPYRYNALLTCSPEPGDYRVVMQDSYGDGWQTSNGSGGPGITIDIDGVITEVGMCSYGASSSYDCIPSPDGYTSYGDDPQTCSTPGGYCFTGPVEAIVTVPVGAVSATWNFPGDNYGEIAFDVYAPDGTLLYSAGFGETNAGLLPITFCAK